MALLARCIVGLFSILVVSAPAVAQSDAALQAKLDETKAYILKQHVSATYRESVRSAVVAYESGLEGHCKDVALDFESSDVRDKLLALVELNDKGEPVAGAWRESVPGTACGLKRKYNVQVNLTPKGSRFTPTYPGDAEGDPELQADTLQNMEKAMQVLRLLPKKSCKLSVTDTHLVGAESKMQASGLMTPWKETWDVQSCGKSFTVPVTYTPDSTGTSLSVGASDIQAR